jgi:hypothetical protein
MYVQCFHAAVRAAFANQAALSIAVLNAKAIDDIEADNLHQLCVSNLQGQITD